MDAGASPEATRLQLLVREKISGRQHVDDHGDVGLWAIATVRRAE